MSRSQALSLRCAEPGGRVGMFRFSPSPRPQDLSSVRLPAPPRPPASLPTTSGRWAAPSLQGTGRLLPGCALLYQGLRLWTQETGPRKCRAAQRVGWKQTVQFICHLAQLSSPQKLQGEEPDTDNVRGHRRASQIGACINYLWEPFTPALLPFWGRPSHQPGQSLLCATSGPGLPGCWGHIRHY